MNFFFICDTPQCFRKMHTFFSNFCKCLSFDSHFLQSKGAFSLTSAKSELQKLTRVRVVDNSFYATEPYRRKPRVIAVYKPGKPGRQRAIIGDKVLVAIRGQKMKAIVVGCRQMPGPFIPRFDTNNVVLLDDKGNPCGNRITGKILTIADDVPNDLSSGSYENCFHLLTDCSTSFPNKLFCAT